MADILIAGAYKPGPYTWTTHLATYIDNNGTLQTFRMYTANATVDRGTNRLSLHMAGNLDEHVILSGGCMSVLEDGEYLLYSVVGEPIVDAIALAIKYYIASPFDRVYIGVDDFIDNNELADSHNLMTHLGIVDSDGELDMAKYMTPPPEWRPLTSVDKGFIHGSCL